MSALHTLDALWLAGVRVSARGANLVLDAPAGALVPELMDAIRTNKDEILELISAFDSCDCRACTARSDDRRAVPL